MYGIETRKTEKKRAPPMKMKQLSLVAIILLLCVFMAFTAHAVSPFEAMPFQTKAWQQLTVGMEAESDFIDRSIKEEKLDDDTAHLLFVSVIDDVMTKCRYSLDKTILKIAKNGLDKDVLDRMRKVGVDGFIGSCFFLLQKKGLGEQAVELGIFSDGTLNAVRDTNMGKETK